MNELTKTVAYLGDHRTGVLVQSYLFAVSTGDTGSPSGSQTNYGDLTQRGANVSAVFAPNFYAKVGDGIPM